MSSKYAERFTEICDSCTQKANSLISEYNETLKEYTENLEKIKITSDAIDDIRNAISQDRDNIAEIYNETKKYLNGLKDIYADIEDSQNKITDIYNEIVKLNTYIYGEDKKIYIPVSQVNFSTLPQENRIQKDGKYYEIKVKHQIGKKEEFDDLLTKLSDYVTSEKSRIKNHTAEVNSETKKLYSQIESLLPGATAAGLTAAYEDAKEKALDSIKFWQTCFMASLILIAVVIFALLYFGFISLSGDLGFEKTIVQIFKLFGCEFPCIWFAWASNIKIAQYTRILEEYRNKWAMARTFEGMRKAILEAEISEEHRENFYRAMLDVFSDNPSKVFDKKYDPDGPASILNKVFDKLPSVKEINKSTNKE